MNRHDWIVVSTGMYDSEYQCSFCKNIHIESIDAPETKLPEYGCRGMQMKDYDSVTVEEDGPDSKCELTVTKFESGEIVLKIRNFTSGNNLSVNFNYNGSDRNSKNMAALAFFHLLKATEESYQKEEPKILIKKYCNACSELFLPDNEFVTFCTACKIEIDNDEREFNNND